MTVNGWIQIALDCAIIIAITAPFGGYMTRVFNGERTLLSPVLRPLERLFYVVSGVDEKEDQHWETYTPETAMSYLVQMAGLTVHNFVSAATGIALAVALVRGFARRSAQGVGNFWVDLTRCTLYILLPISIVIGLFYVWQGMPQNLGAYISATTLE